MQQQIKKKSLRILVNQIKASLLVTDLLHITICWQKREDQLADQQYALGLSRFPNWNKKSVRTVKPPLILCLNLVKIEKEGKSKPSLKNLVHWLL